MTAFAMYKWLQCLWQWENDSTHVVCFLTGMKLSCHFFFFFQSSREQSEKSPNIATKLATLAACVNKRLGQYYCKVSFVSSKSLSHANVTAS